MSPHAPHEATVLVADDDPATLRLIEKIVSAAGYHVLLARDGCEALNLVLGENPDLVVSDWDMPGMTGPALCEAIRRAEPSKYVYVVLLTARTTDAEMVQGLEAGADDFIVKPIKAPILRARLRAGARIVAMERRLLEASQCDPLTGVLNRRTFRQRFGQEWERALRYDRPLSCVMVDLDFFKRVNDTHGHAAGDLALKTVAAVLQDRCRSTDAICRYGGEEFCILLPETDEAGAAAWADRTRVAMAQTIISLGEPVLHITGSLGVAERLADTTGPDALIELADQALAVAKQSGRNSVVRQSSLKETAADLCGNSALRAPLAGILARDVMVPALLCPLEDDTLAQVSDLLLDLRIASVPVIRQDGQLAGIVSEIDLARATVQGGGWNRPIREVMKAQVVTFDEDTPAHQVLDFLSRASLRRVVVVADGSPTGVISRACFLRWLRNWSTMHPEAGADHPAGSSTREHDREILRVLEAAEKRLSDLRVRAGQEAADCVPGLVTEASRLQEIANDLLGHSGTGHEF